MARDDGGMLLGALIGAGLLWWWQKQKGVTTQYDCPPGEVWNATLGQCVPGLGGDSIHWPNGAEIVYVQGGMGREPGNPLPLVERGIALYYCQFTINYTGPTMPVTIDLTVGGTTCRTRITRTIGASSVPVSLTFYLRGEMWLCGEVNGNVYPVVMTMSDPARNGEVILSKLLGEVVA